TVDVGSLLVQCLGSAVHNKYYFTLRARRCNADRFNRAVCSDIMAAYEGTAGRREAGAGRSVVARLLWRAGCFRVIGIFVLAIFCQLPARFERVLGLVFAGFVLRVSVVSGRVFVGNKTA